MGYIAIRHNDLRGPSRSLYIDDLQYYTPWTSAGIVEGGQYVFNGLMPGTAYQARVRTECAMGYMGYWSNSVSFSTPYNIVFEDPITKSACLTWDVIGGNNDGELSYAEAAAVNNLGTVFKDQVEMHSFNELQYFTGLTEICTYAFAGCTNLSAITLPNTITTIGSYAFGYSVNQQGQTVPCSSLQSIVIPPGVTTIGNYAFCESGLTAIDLPYSVTTVGTLAFGDCNSLVSVYLPATVTNIQGNAFTGSSIASIEVDAGNPVYDSRNGCNAIIHTQSNTLITGCKNTVVPYGVTAIGGSAFENCSGLTDITLPATVGTLDDYAFLNCTSLRTIEVDATTPPTLGEATFGNLTWSNIKVYVPCGSLDTYQDSDWSGFDLAENCNIEFEDLLTKELCVNAWDRNYDGELSYREAAAVTDITNQFNGENITRFNELQYFTGLTSIGENAFIDCFQLVAVTLPLTVTEIENYAFENCNSLACITLGENIINIGEFAFNSCEGLQFIKVEAITPPVTDATAFYGVDADIPVYVPCGTLSAYQAATGWSGFDNFIDMCANIVFEDPDVKALCVDINRGWDTNNDGELSYAEAAAVTDIGYVFHNHNNISTFDEFQHFIGVTTIGERAFSYNEVLTSVTIPVSVTTIEHNAFSVCPILTSITIPNSVTTIGHSAFAVSGLTSAIIPASVTHMDANIFAECESLMSIEVDGDNPVYDSRNGCNAIIETATNTLIVGCKNTVIPGDVVEIAYHAFDGCTGLTSITLPSSVAEIGYNAFGNCTNLSEIHVEATTPPNLGYNVFNGLNLDDIWVYVPCGAQGDYENDDDWGEFYYIIDPCANIYFEDGIVKEICVANFDTNNDGEISYAEAAAVTSLNLKFNGRTDITWFNELQYFTGLSMIEAQDFFGCTILTEVTLPPHITAIGTGAFYGCTDLENVVIPSTVTTLHSQAFYGTDITEVVVPNSVTLMGNSVFGNCSNLTTASLPASVLTISSNPFEYCPALTTITVDPANPVFFDNNCNAIIRRDNNKLISGCGDTYIPDNVVSIGPKAFAGITSLNTVTLPGGVTSIDAEAFKDCTGLQSITVIRAIPPTVGNNAFANVSNTIPVYVPCHSIEDYQGTTGWSNFTNIQARTDVICFEDPAVKAICVAYWDADGDGELSYAEAAAVHYLNPTGINNNSAFKENTEITSFDELQYFTGLTSICLYAFQNCTNLQSITLPPNVTQIKYSAFFGCTSLASIDLPSSLTTIEQDGFHNCSGLTSLTLGENVTTIASSAFSNCTNLASITILAMTPPTLGQYDPFNNVDKDIPVYVPCNAWAAYRFYDNQDPWGGFTNITGDGCYQSFSLVEGWNWWTPYLEMELSELEIALTGKAVLINSQEDGFVRYENGNCSGTLTSVVPGKMYKILATQSVMFMTILGDQPSDVTVEIKPGYNWFGYTASTRSVAYGMYYYTPEEGDTITDQDGHTATYANGQWGGTLTQLVRGKGYLYHSNATQTKTMLLNW